MQVGLRQIQQERMLHPNEHIRCLVNIKLSTIGSQAPQEISSQ